MPMDLVTIPCRSDNYAYLFHDAASGETALIDIPEAQPILDELDRRGWMLSQIWITHHHPDHVEGREGVLAKHPAPVTGGKADAHRLPQLARERLGKALYRPEFLDGDKCYCFEIRKPLRYQQMCDYIIHVKMVDKCLGGRSKFFHPPLGFLPLCHDVNFPTCKVGSQPHILAPPANSQAE